jgi:hypothetical protein
MVSIQSSHLLSSCSITTSLGSLSSAYVKIYETVYEDVMRREMFPSATSSFLCQDQDTAPSLCPILTLLTTCQSMTQNDLSELGILLGAPLELPRQVPPPI